MSIDYLIGGTRDLAGISYEASLRSRPENRTPTYWIIEAAVAKAAGSLLGSNAIFHLLAGATLSNSSNGPPRFSKDFAANFETTFGRSLEATYQAGQLMCQDRACNVSRFSAKAMAQKCTHKDALKIEVGDELLCSRVTFFSNGGKNQLFVLVGVEKMTQMLSDAVRAYTNDLQIVLELCDARNKVGAEKALAAAKASWSDAVAAAEEKQEHYEMTTDKDGFPPIVPTTQPFTPVFLAARHSLKGPVASESTQSALSSAAVRRSSDGVKEGIIGGRVWSSSNSPPPEALHE
eukprot:gene21226-4346_t